MRKLKDDCEEYESLELHIFLMSAILRGRKKEEEEEEEEKEKEEEEEKKEMQQEN